MNTKCLQLKAHLKNYKRTQKKFYRILLIVLWLNKRALAMPCEHPLTNTIDALLMATSVPVPMAIHNTQYFSYDARITGKQKRLESIKGSIRTHSLMPFVGNPRQYMPKCIAFSLKAYCELVDITGRIIRGTKQDILTINNNPSYEDWAYQTNNG